MLRLLRRRRSPAWGTLSWTGLGALVLGAGAMYLLDPEGGRRRRHELLRRTGRVGRGTAEDFGRAARDLGNRTVGLFAACRRWFRRDETTGERPHVDNQVGVFEEPPDTPAVQGALARTGPRPELLKENGTPGVRLLAAVGSAVVVAAVGAAVAAALGNRPLGRLVGLRR